MPIDNRIKDDGKNKQFSIGVDWEEATFIEEK